MWLVVTSAGSTLLINSCGECQVIVVVYVPLFGIRCGFLTTNLLGRILETAHTLFMVAAWLASPQVPPMS